MGIEEGMGNYAMKRMLQVVDAENRPVIGFAQEKIEIK